jgi:hypothetical protein
MPSAQTFRLSSSDADAVAKLHAQKPYLSIQRVVIYMYIHHRLLKLHRLYMPRAYQGTDPKYHNSREVCLESADVILSCYNELVQADSPLHRWWSFRMWLFDAVSTLQIDLLYRIAQPLDSNLIRRQADVEQGINLLQPHTTLEKSNKFLPAAISALRALQREEKLKRIAHKRKAETEAMASKEDGRSKWKELTPLDTSAVFARNVASNGEGDVPPTPSSISAMALAAFEPPSPFSQMPGDSSAPWAVDTVAAPLPASAGAEHGQALLDQFGELTAQLPQVVQPGGAVPSGAPEAWQLNVNDLDAWLRSVSGHMAAEPQGMGAARLIDRLLGEMDFGDWQ